MNKQETFDFVVNHLRSQGERSATTELKDDRLHMPPTCLYLNETGLKCAIGCLIPDGHSGQHYIGNVYALTKKYPDLLDRLVPKEFSQKMGLELLSGLQSVHDVQGSWDDNGLSQRGEFRLENLADSYGLNYSPPSA